MIIDVYMYIFVKEKTKIAFGKDENRIKKLCCLLVYPRAYERYRISILPIYASKLEERNRSLRMRNLYSLSF